MILKSAKKNLNHPCKIPFFCRWIFDFLGNRGQVNPGVFDDLPSFIFHSVGDQRHPVSS